MAPSKYALLLTITVSLPPAAAGCGAPLTPPDHDAAGGSSGTETVRWFGGGLPDDAGRGGAGGADPGPALRVRFPKGFLFGTAIAGFQAEMGCPTIAPERCEDRGSDWYQWVTTERIVDNPLLFMSKDPISSSPGFFELYEADLDRAARELSTNAFRLSIEWSRLFPEPTFGIDDPAALRRKASAEGLAYYHALLGAMKARGLKPLVTVSHYALPLWIHDGDDCNRDFERCTRRGFADRDTIVPEIAKYAGFLGREFGGEVDLWATENEPFSAVVLPGYLLPSPTRTNPPGLYLKTAAAKDVTMTLIEAHARMVDALRANDREDADGDGRATSVGLVYNVTAVEPLTENSADAQAAENARYLLNDLFLNGVAKGIVDPRWDGVTEARADLAGRLDWLGVNYYATIKAQANIVPSPLELVSPYFTFNPLNAQTDMVRAKGLYDVLKDMSKYGLPMIVTETGVDQAEDPALGARWVAETTQWMGKAMAEGVPVDGYIVWTLMDNYEWNHGMAMRFGLYAVDGDDPLKIRTPREAVSVVRAIGSAGGVPLDLAERYPITP